MPPGDGVPPLGVDIVVKRLGGLIAWISASLAGLGAVLYAVGFLATKTHDSVLGVAFDFASRDQFSNVVRGLSVLSTTAVGSVLGMLAFFAASAALRAILRRAPALPGSAGRALRRWSGAAATPASALAMLALALVGLNIFMPALDVEGLLFAAPPTPEMCRSYAELGFAEAMRHATLMQDGAYRREAFLVYAVSLGMLFGLGMQAWPRLVAPGARPVWRIGGGVAIGFAVVGMPLAYATLLLQAEAPRVALAPPLEDVEGRMRLLSRDEASLLLWLEDDRRLRWIRAGGVQAITVGESFAIVPDICPDDAGGQGEETS